MPLMKNKKEKKKAMKQYLAGETSHIEVDIHDVADVYRDDEFTDKELSDIAILAGYTQSEIQWILGIRRTRASKTKTFEVKYEKDGKTVTTSISARNSSEARKYVKNQHPDAKIIDVYEI